MAEAFRLAFLSLLKKSLGLSAVAAAAISDQVSDKRLADSVFDYSVENEKYSDSHYMVKVSCRFSRSVIGALLKSIGWVPEIAPDGSTSSGNVSVPDSSATIAVKLAVYLDDFICHFHELNELNCRVIGLLPRVAIFVLDSSCLGEFCALGIRYAYVTAQ
jgi:hypothetical protein